MTVWGTTAEKTTSSTSAGGLRVEGKVVSIQAWTKESETAAPPISTSNILWGAAATALVGATLADWQRKREEEEARRAAAREERQANGPGTYRQAAMDYQRAVDNFKATLNDAVNKGMSKAEADQLKADVINSGKIGASLGVAQGYIAKKEKEADTQADWIEKQEAANAAILQEVLVAQEAQRKAEELQAGMLAYYQGRKEGEVTVVPQEEEKKSWWEEAGERLDQTWTSGRDWVNRAVQAIPNIGRAILLAPVQVNKKTNGKFTFPINQDMLNGLSSLTSKIQPFASKFGLDISIPRDLSEYRTMILEKTGFDTILSTSRKKAGGIGKDALIDRLKEGIWSDWTKRVDDFKNGLSDLSGRFTSMFTKNAAEEVAEEVAKGTLEATTKEVAGEAARAGFGKLFKAVSPGVLDALVDTGFNIYDYTFGDKKNEIDKPQQVTISSVVDIGGSLLTGALAAGAVAGLIALAGVTAPIWATVGLTIIIGAALDVGLEALGWKEPIKNWLNQQWDKAEPVVANWWNASFNQPSPVPAQPPIPAPMAPTSPPMSTATPPTPTATPSAPPLETPTATPNP